MSHARRRSLLSLLPSLALATGLALLPGCGGGGAGGGDGTGDGSGDGSGDGGGTGGGGTGGGGGTAAAFRLLATNDLGMHCMDREFSIFSILPPFNVIRAQVTGPSTGGAPRVLSDADVVVTYEGVPDVSGSINTRSIGKTDFWAHASALFGAALPPGQGLTGLYMPADAPVPGPQRLAYDAARGAFLAAGIPITPTDDAGRTNTYPMLRLRARSVSTGAEVARLDIVVPVAQETDCSTCHRTGASAASRAGVTWSTDADLERQTKLNVLKLHDAVSGTSLMTQQPVLCASCHYSKALDLGGTGPGGSQVGHATFSSAMHSWHGALRAPGGQPVFPPGGSALSTCYQCHPGAITQCARGIMVTGGLACLNCHGDMSAVGGDHPLLAGGSIDGAADGAGRRPWTDLPRCQSCHTGDASSHLSGTGLVPAVDGIRLAQAWRTGDAAASPIRSASSRFAEQANTLYRNSRGHGGLLCQDCHGSTHAEWPVADPASNDNVAASQIQGHTGAVLECTACHAAGSLALTMQGPHGLHNVNDARWVGGGHGGSFENNPASCRACHGANLQGTPLSKTPVDRTFNVEDAGRVTLRAGTQVGCGHCHSTPH